MAENHQLQPVCLRHNKTCQIHVQEVINFLRSHKLLSEVHLVRFNNLLCTCGQAKKAYDNQWTDVPDEKIASAYTYLDEHISSNFTNKDYDLTIFKKIMHWLRNAVNMSQHPSLLHHHCSAARLVYLLMMIIKKDYCIFDVNLTAEEKEKKVFKEETYTFEVKKCDPGSVGKLIGTDGQNIKLFQTKYKCWIKFEILDGKVMATIKKRVTDIKTLAEIATLLQTHCETYQRDAKQQMEVDVPSLNGSTVPGIVDITATIEANLAADLPGNSNIGHNTSPLPNPNLVPNPDTGDPGAVSQSHSDASWKPPGAPDIRLDDLSLNQPDQNTVPENARAVSNSQLSEPSCKKHKTQ